MKFSLECCASANMVETTHYLYFITRVLIATYQNLLQRHTYDLCWASIVKNLAILIYLILGAPLTMGGKMFNPFRLSAIPSPCIFNLNFNLVGECLKYFRLSRTRCCIKFKFVFLLSLDGWHVHWTRMEPPLVWANKNLPSSYMSRSLYQYSQYVTIVQFYCQNGGQSTLWVPFRI